jgi:hypothetical protein
MKRAIPIFSVAFAFCATFAIAVPAQATESDRTGGPVSEFGVTQVGAPGSSDYVLCAPGNCPEHTLKHVVPPASPPVYRPVAAPLAAAAQASTPIPHSQRHVRHGRHARRHSLRPASAGVPSACMPAASR